MMIAVRLILLAAFIQPTPAHACRLHRIWRFPWPQRCAVALVGWQRPGHAGTAREAPRSSVGSLAPPEAKLMAPPADAARRPRPIGDDEAHAIGIEALKVLIDQMKPQ
jgi:hypothetical protein